MQIYDHPDQCNQIKTVKTGREGLTIRFDCANPTSERLTVYVISFHMKVMSRKSLNHLHSPAHVILSLDFFNFFAVRTTFICTSPSEHHNVSQYKQVPFVN